VIFTHFITKDSTKAVRSCRDNLSFFFSDVGPGSVSNAAACPSSGAEEATDDAFTVAANKTGRNKIHDHGLWSQACLVQFCCSAQKNNEKETASLSLGAD
jgi:hypothetical protein